MCSVLEVERKNARSAEKTIAVSSEQITGVEEGESAAASDFLVAAILPRSLHSEPANLRWLSGRDDSFARFVAGRRKMFVIG
jgi:hypothetical protein